MTNEQHTGRRRDLDSMGALAHSTNASLWFDRYFKILDSNDAKRDHMNATTSLGVSSDYPAFFMRYTAALHEQGCLLAHAEVQGRMVVGTGDKGVAEAGIALHHTYGVPYIPGSALKGLAATYANRYIKGFEEPSRLPERIDEITNYHILFGADNSAGYVTFFDALYVPQSPVNNARPLAPDIITGHHGAYYVSGDQPPADWDSPVPVPFLTATGRYLIAVNGHGEWAKTALRILGCALRDLGIGAKTAAGYGRMRLLSIDGIPIELPVPLQESTLDDPLAGPHLPQKGDIITGQCERNPTTITVEGERVRMVRVQPNRSVAYDLPQGSRLEIFVNEKESGGISGRVMAIDDSQPGVIRLFIRREKRQRD